MLKLLLLWMVPSYLLAGELLINSDQMQVNDISGEAIYTGHVKMVHDSKTLQADKLIISRNKRGQVIAIQAFGAPCVLQNERGKIESDILYYDYLKELLTSTKQAKVTFYLPSDNK